MPVTGRLSCTRKFEILILKFHPRDIAKFCAQPFNITVALIDWAQFLYTETCCHLDTSAMKRVIYLTFLSHCIRHVHIYQSLTLILKLCHVLHFSDASDFVDFY